MLLVLLDIHQNISSARGFIRYTTHDSNNNISLILKTDCICLHMYSNATLNRQLKFIMPGKILQPSTTCLPQENSSSLKFNKEDNSVTLNVPLPSPNCETNLDHTLEATFRIQISDTSSIQVSSNGNVSSPKFRDFIKNKVQRNQIYDLICTNCGSSLSNKIIKLEYIHEYHEELSELSENWFCHNHDEFNSSELHNESLYIGDVYLYFHDSTVKLMKLSESDKQYKCSNCATILSLKKKMSNPSFTGFFSDKVMLQNSSIELNNIKEYKMDTALVSFCSILENILKSELSCKIYLENRMEDKTDCLLLWVNCKRIAQFLFLEENNENIPSETEFKAKEIFKVLYCACLSDSEIARRWKHDFSVEFFQVSDNMISVLSNLLQKSSHYFPRNQDTIDGFSFGYLPAFVS